MMKNIIELKNIRYVDDTNPAGCSGIPMEPVINIECPGIPLEPPVNLGCPGIPLKIEGISSVIFYYTDLLFICKSIAIVFGILLALGCFLTGTISIILRFNTSKNESKNFWDTTTWVPNPNWGGRIPSRREAPPGGNSYPLPPRITDPPVPVPVPVPVAIPVPVPVEPTPLDLVPLEPTPVEPKAEASGPPSKFEEYKQS